MGWIRFLFYSLLILKPLLAVQEGDEIFPFDLNKTPVGSPSHDEQIDMQTQIPQSKKGDVKQRTDRKEYMRKRYHSLTKEQKDVLLDKKKKRYKNMNLPKKMEYLKVKRLYYQGLPDSEKQRRNERKRIYRQEQKLQPVGEIERRKIAKRLKERQRKASLPAEVLEQKRRIKNEKARERRQKKD